MNTHAPMLRVVTLTNSQVDDTRDLVTPTPLPTILLIGATTDAAPSVSFCTENEAIERLSRFSSDGCVAFLESHLVELFLKNYKPLVRELDSCTKAFTLLAEHKTAPSHMRRYDGTIASFLGKGLNWRDVACAPSNGDFLHAVCYGVLSSILSNRFLVNSIQVRQLSVNGSSTPPHIDCSPGVAVIIPHRHSLAYLDATLTYVARMKWPSTVRGAVGLDVDDIEPYVSLKALPNVSLYCCDSSRPVGPYILRQGMIENAKEELVLLQDSDDIPCSDRLTALYSRLVESGSDMVGSHELEVNEIDRQIRIYRFPLDVSAVLRNTDTTGVSDNAEEPFLHATAIMRRQSFLSAGGFSTNRRIANDSQFLLRASFSLRISNVDAFVYIRRVHRTALTVAPETQNGNELRRMLSQTWGTDFKRVKRRELTLSESALAPVRAIEEPRLKML